MMRLLNTNNKRLVLTMVLLFSSALANAEQYDAVLYWSKRATLGTLSTGVVDKVFVDVGDRVKQGDLLLQLDPVVFEKRVRQTAIALKSADEIYLEAKRERERSQELYDRTVLSDHDLQVAKNNEIQAQAGLEHARLEYARAKYDLKYSQVIAPFNALILQRQVQPGQVVSSELQPVTLLVVADSDHMRARIEVKEAELRRLKMQQTAKVNVGEMKFAGQVVAIGFEPINDGGKTGAYPVDIEFATAGEIMRAGLSAKVELE